MKKLFLLGAFALFGAMNAQAGPQLGLNVGLPIGDAGDVYSFKVGVDVGYLWPVEESFNLGVATGYQAWFGKTISYGMSDYKVPTLSLVPIAASGQYRFTPEFSLGVDLGYGLLFQDGENDGGFYYQPKAAYHFGANRVYLSYAGVSKDGNSISSINLGFTHSFGK